MHLSLRTSLSVGLAAVMALMLAVSIIAVHELHVGADHTEDLAETAVPEARALGEMSTQIYALRSAQADLVSGGRRRVALLRPVIAGNVAAMKHVIARYRRISSDADHRRRLAAFDETWSSYVSETAGLAYEVEIGDYPAAEAVLSRPLPLFARAQAQLRSLTAVEDRNIEQAVAAARAGNHRAKDLMVKLTVIGLLLCLLIAIAMRRTSDRGITLLSGFRSAFEDSGHGGALLDGRDHVVHVNRALCRILERPASEIEGRRWDDVLVPAADGGSERTFFDVRGEERRVALTRSPVADTNQQLRVQAVLQVQDVTERRRAELALGDSEERFRTAFDETNIGMAIVDAEGHVLRINAALEQTILGYDPEELVGRPILELTHPDDQQADIEAAALLVSGSERTIEHERRYRHRNGWWIWCHLNLSAVHADGQVRQFVVQIQDVMQRRAVEQFLRESEDRYRSLVEHLPLITYRDRLDEENSTLFMSPQIEDLLGYPVQDWIDDPTMLARCIHPEDHDRALAEIQHANDELIDLRCEFRTVSRDGRIAHVVKEGVVVFDDDGVPLYRQGYILDATDRRALEEQLRLAQKLESVGQMAAGIAHEINTPIQFVGDSVAFAREAVQDLLAIGPAVLTAIDALPPSPDAEAIRAAVLAAEEDADVEYLRERLPAAFDRTADGIERVASIVRAMKAFAHPSNGAHGAVDLNESVRTTLVVAKAEYKYVADVDLDLDETLPVISGDGGGLNQVLLNIIVNAGHAIGDRVAEGAERGRIAIATRHDDARVTVTITDTGGGIPDAVRARIFDPFFTTKEVGRGTGQGLAIARSIVVDSHGGTIDVESTAGVGTTMTVTLPIAAQTDLAEAA